VGERAVRLSLDSDRFEVGGILGRGAMSIVYRAFDRERNVPVALKWLRRVDANAVFRFKREFRVLAGLSHAHVVKVHELVQSEGDLLIAMELIEGPPFGAHLRGRGNSADRTPHAATLTLDTLDVPPGSKPQPPLRRTTGPVLALPKPLNADLMPRLRRDLLQLGQGLMALHTAGIVHRDIKPSNVLVESGSGRVVLLDFGVVGEIAGDAGADARLVGTPSYMAPEQAAGEQATPASDWYAVGVLLYETLTGQRPFIGDADKVLADKLVRSARPVRDLAPRAPADLADLCDALLERSPGRRPGAPEIHEVLGASTKSAPVMASVSGARPGARIYGRRPQLMLLHEALDAVQNGQQRTVFVHGVSGIGKTALVETFLAEARDRTQPLILTSRCFERESLRYKAVDGLIDELTRYVETLDSATGRRIVPLDVRALARLFPSVDLLAERYVPGDNRPESFDPVGARERAFNALRAMLQAIAQRRTVVLHLDDVQWGDIDSAALLDRVFRQPLPPPVLLIATYRREDAGSSAFVQSLRRSFADAAVLGIDPLSRNDSLDMAHELLGEGGPMVARLAGSICRESGGNPLLVEELARFISTDEGSSHSLSGDISLDQLLRAKLDRLPRGARVLAELIAVSGEPVAQRLVLAAVGPNVDGEATLATLRDKNIVRTRGSRPGDAVECFHDRVRSGILGRITLEDRRKRHAQLAETMLRLGVDEPEKLAFHFTGAGDLSRANSYTLAAAELAEKALAFDKAATLYRRAIDNGADAPDLNAHLARALGAAGKQAEAAPLFLQAAEAAQDDDERLDLLREAARALLACGHVEQGSETLLEVLDAVGLSMPRSARRAAFDLWWQRLRVRRRGLDFEERAPEDIPPLVRRRLDACWTAATYLALRNAIVGATFQARHLLGSLDSGDPGQIARALALEAVFAAGAGDLDRADAVAERSHKLASEAGEAPITGLASAARGMSAYSRGNWRLAHQGVSEALELLSARASEPWEYTTAQMFCAWSLFYLGELGELSQRVPDIVRESEQRGDVFTADVMATGLTNTAWLVRNDVDTARERQRIARERLPGQEFEMRHYWCWIARVYTDLYLGNGAAAYRDTRLVWKQLDSSMLARVPSVALNAHQLRARTALADALADPTNRPARLREARRSIRTLERLGTPSARAIAALEQAACDHVRGDVDACERSLARAAELLDSADMPFHAAAAHIRRARVIGGSAGDVLESRARSFLTDQGAVNPDSLVAMVTPGFGDL